MEEEVLKGRRADLYMEEYAECEDLEAFKDDPLYAEIGREFTKQNTWKIKARGPGRKPMSASSTRGGYTRRARGSTW